MSSCSTPESNDFQKQYVFSQKIQDEFNNTTSQQIEQLTRYIHALEAKLEVKENSSKSVNKAAFSFLAKPTPWNGNPETWVDFEVDIKAYLELSGNDFDLYRVTWTTGFLVDPAKKFAQNFRATHPNCSFIVFIESLKANFNVNSAIELCLRKLRTLKFNNGDDITAHLARFNDLRLTARIQDPNLAMPYLVDSLHNVFGEDLAKIAVFSPAILSDYETLNRWLLSIHDAASKTRFFSVKHHTMDMTDLSSLSISQISQT
jgi:hypothetical protein